MNDLWLMLIPLTVISVLVFMVVGFVEGFRRLMWKHERRAIKWSDLF